MIGGFEEPTSGLIELQGEDVTWLPPHKRNVNTVFQNYALFPHLTIYENVAFGLRRKVVRTRRSSGASRRCWSWSSCRASSGASRARSPAARPSAWRSPGRSINRPAVLLLDEPLGALDLKLRKQMQVELKRIQQEVGITFIYVTHDQEEAMTMSDRIAVMNRGRYEQLGIPGGALRAPGDALRRRLPGRQQPAAGGRPEAATDGYAAVQARPTAPRPCARALARWPHGRVGRRRPAGEDPDAERETSRAARRQPAARRRSATPRTRGVSTQYQVELPDGRASRSTSRTSSGHASRAVAPGEEVVLGWAPDDTFAVETGRATTARPSAGRRRSTGRHARTNATHDRRPAASHPIPSLTRRPLPARPRARRTRTPSSMPAARRGAGSSSRGGAAARPRSGAPPPAARIGRAVAPARTPAAPSSWPPGSATSTSERMGATRRSSGSRRRPASTVDYQEAVDDNECSSPPTSRPRSRQACRPGWDIVVRHRLDGPAPGRARLAGDHRHGRTPNYPANLEDIYTARSLGPGQRPRRAVAVGHDRAGLRQGADRRPDLARHPVLRPRSQGS